MAKQQPKFFSNSLPYKVSPVDGGSAGPPGQNGYTVTTASFSQPSVGSNVLVSVENSAWMGVQSVSFVQSGGSYLVVSVPDATHVTLKNLGYLGNASPGDTIASGELVGPGGLEGPVGPEGPPGNGSFFGVQISTTSAGPEVFYGSAGTDTDPSNVAGHTITGAISFTKVSAAISPGVFVSPAPVYRIKLYVSTNGGISYSFLTGATIDLKIGSVNHDTASFPAVSLAGGSVHLISVQQLSGGSNTLNRPLAVTWS